jgi:hypothetical protein
MASIRRLAAILAADVAGFGSRYREPAILSSCSTGPARKPRGMRRGTKVSESVKSVIFYFHYFQPFSLIRLHPFWCNREYAR